MQLHHTAVKVPDELFETELAFYTEFLGLPCLRRWPTGALLDAGGSRIELLKHGDGLPAAGALHHFAFDVEEPFRWAERLRAGGWEITRGPETLTIPAAEPCPVEMVFFRGPAGELIELYRER